THAVKELERIRAEKVQEIKDTYKDRRDLTEQDTKERKAKTEERIKDKDQLALALSEIDLDHRKRETALNEEERETLEKTEDLFGRLVNIVKEAKKYHFLSEDEYDQLFQYGVADFVEVKMGAEAILEALKAVDLEDLSKKLREEISG